jgi:hypothetical protein
MPANEIEPQHHSDIFDRDGSGFRRTFTRHQYSMDLIAARFPKAETRPVSWTYVHADTQSPPTESASSALGRCPGQTKKDDTPSAIRNTGLKTRPPSLRIVDLSERCTTDACLKYHGDAMGWIVLLLRGTGHLDDDLLGKLSRGEVECSHRYFNAACIDIAHICLPPRARVRGVHEA